MLHMKMSQEIISWDTENQVEMTFIYGSIRRESTLLLNISEFGSIVVAQLIAVQRCRWRAKIEEMEVNSSGWMFVRASNLF